MKKKERRWEVKGILVRNKKYKLPRPRRYGISDELFLTEFSRLRKVMSNLKFVCLGKKPRICISGHHCSFRSVNKKPTYKPTYVRKNIPEATRKKIYMASNGQ